MITRRSLFTLPLALPAAPLRFTISHDIPLQKASPEFCWFHPRVAAIPAATPRALPRVIMTLSQHLDADDHYSGLWFITSNDLGKTWSTPQAPPQLAARQEPNGLHSSVHDVTPIWHPQSKKILAIGGRTFYQPSGKHISGEINQGGTAYAVFHPATNNWSGWQPLQLPNEKIFANCRSACSQLHVKPDGTLLIPVYFQQIGTPFDAVTVLECRFDGRRLQYLRHGSILKDDSKRGLAEPSIAFHAGRYFLTIRHDLYGYVAASDDGLNWTPLKRWQFDTGADLGSFNTQQHWLPHSDALFLSYTSRRDHNKHIPRARAPLFIAQVDPTKLHVLQQTEQILIPERGLMLGNFGANSITPSESWVTDAEFLWFSHGYKPTEKGGNGSVWIARVHWSSPNKLHPSK